MARRTSTGKKMKKTHIDGSQQNAINRSPKRIPKYTSLRGADSEGGEYTSLLVRRRAAPGEIVLERWHRLYNVRFIFVWELLRTSAPYPIN